MPYAKRSIKAGYPVDARFETREQIDAYFSGARVVCLQCGHSYRILEAHLRGVHGMTGDDYREMYCLPFQRGLCAADFSAQRVEHGKRLFEENQERQTAAINKAREAQRQAGGNAQRHKPDFWKKERTKFTRADFEEFARRVRSGRSGNTVQHDEDMPTKQHVLWFVKRDKEFAELWKTTKCE
jgi:hypothetical protein